MSLRSRGLIKSPLPDYALEQKSYPTDAQAVKTVTARTPAIQYLTLNSKDRFQTSTLGQSADQPWNQFRLQRPQNIMNAYATRIGVSEVRFPYYIPNVNANNNVLYITAFNSALTLSTFKITVNPGFYNGTTLATALNSIINNSTTYGFYQVWIGPPATPFNPATIPVFSFTTTSQFQYNPSGGGAGSALYAFPPSNIGTEEEYNNNPSLCNLMGFAYQQVTEPFAEQSTPAFSGRITTMTYTDYIDIVSEKFNQHASARDGSSDGASNRSLICRLYLSPENGTMYDPGLPFTIYRQFKNPKMVEWDKMASVDWLDIALYDEYGELLPLPAPVSLPNNAGLISGGSYPDFQITLIASQD